MKILRLGGTSDRRRAFGDALLAALGRPGYDPFALRGRRPDAIVWLGGDAASDLSRLQRAIDGLDADTDDVPVFAVVDTSDDARGLPIAIQHFNAIILSNLAVAPDDQWLGAADVVLSAAWRGTRRRRVFLSYFRQESTPVAMQLKRELELRGFDVFLDLTEVPQGRNFQRRLRASLVDTDLVVVLLSPRLGTRPWCTYEISYANAAHIGLLALVWPGATDQEETKRIAARLLPDQRIELSDGDFVGGRPDPDAELDPAALERLLALMYKARFSKLRARLEVVEATFRELEKVGGDWTADDLGLLHRRRRGGLERARVLPFRPGVDLLHADYRRLRRGTARLFWSWHEAADPGDATRAVRWLTRGFRDRRGACLLTRPIAVHEEDGES